MRILRLMPLVLAIALLMVSVPGQAAESTAPPSMLAGVILNSSALPSTNPSLDAQRDFVTWMNVVSIHTRPAYLYSIRLSVLGTVSSSNLKNFRFFVDGIQIGPAVEEFDDNRYVTFDFSTSPKKLETGSVTLSLRSDIADDASGSFTVLLQRPADMQLRDVQYDVNILPSVISGNFPVSAGRQTISSVSGLTGSVDMIYGFHRDPVTLQIENVVQKTPVSSLSVTLLISNHTPFSLLVDPSVTIQMRDGSEKSLRFTLREGNKSYDAVLPGKTNKRVMMEVILPENLWGDLNLKFHLNWSQP